MPALHTHSLNRRAHVGYKGPHRRLFPPPDAALTDGRDGSMNDDAVRITIGDDTFIAQWEVDVSPHTCAAFRRLLPYSQKIIHARWSGEACWIPLGTFDLAVGPE